MKRHPGYNAAHYYRPGGAKACAKGNACRQGPNAIKSICPSGVAPRLTLLPLQGVLLGLEPNPGCRSRKTYGFQSLCPGLCARCPCRATLLTSCPSVEAVSIICVKKNKYAMSVNFNISIFRLHFAIYISLSLK